MSIHFMEQYFSSVYITYTNMLAIMNELQTASLSIQDKKLLKELEETSDIHAGAVASVQTAYLNEGIPIDPHIWKSLEKYECMLSKEASLLKAMQARYIYNLQTSTKYSQLEFIDV